MLVPCLLLAHSRREVERGPSALAGFYSTAAAKRLRFSGLLCHRRKHDRLTHHVHILEMNGDSYRLKQSKRRSRNAAADNQPGDATQA